MADPQLTVTETDVKDQNLLLRFLRKVAASITGLGTRIASIEAAPRPMSPAELSGQLSATGTSPLNVQNLLGVLRQPQVAGAPRYPSAPTGQVLQQLQDTQLFLVQSTSTSYDLYTIIGGNPNTASRLISGLSTATVASTSTNLMTLDTVQAATTVATKYFGAPQLFGTSTARVPQRAIHIVGSDGPVPVFPTLLGRDLLIVENNHASYVTLIKSTGAQNAGLNIYVSGGAAPVSYLREFSGVWSVNSNGTNIVTLSSNAMTLAGKITSYNSITTTGEGIPYILATITTSTSTAIGGTNLIASLPAIGTYRLNGYINIQTAGASTALFLDLSYQDDNLVSKTVSIGPISTTSTNNSAGLTFPFRASTSNVLYATRVSPGVAGPYELTVVLERLL